MSDRTVYPQLEAQLPLYGGRPGEELASLLAAEGFVQTAVRPLMDAALWLETPARVRDLWSRGDARGMKQGLRVERRVVNWA